MSFNRENSVVVDIQFVHGNNNECYVKELAFMMCNSITPIYTIFKPPYSQNELNDTAVWQTNFDYNNIHGLKWTDGVVDYTRLSDILQTLKDFTIIVKGFQKAEFLKKFLKSSTIINLDTKVGLGRLKNYRHNCPTHPPIYVRCAINNVFKIFIFMEVEYLLLKRKTTIKKQLLCLIQI